MCIETAKRQLLKSGSAKRRRNNKLFCRLLIQYYIERNLPEKILDTLFIRTHGICTRISVANFGKEQNKTIGTRIDHFFDRNHIDPYI